MPNVFISYSTLDCDFVEEEIVSLLRRNGITTWHARRDVQTAEDWEKSIRRALSECEWFLVVVSKNAISSDWVRSEVDWAMHNRPQRLIPVVKDECDPGSLHLKLRLIQHIDFARDPEIARTELLSTWCRSARYGEAICIPENQELTRNAHWASHVENRDRYTILRTLAVGESSTVFLARENVTQRLVGVKVLNAGGTLNPDWKRIYMLEAGFNQIGLMHPAIVKVYDVHLWDDDQGGAISLVMEYIDGRNLLNHTRTHSLSVTTSAEIVATVAEAIHFAHARGISHGRLTPKKIILDSKLSPHVIGFHDPLRDDLWRMSYRAPECFGGPLFSPKGDIWTLGIILYELLTGRKAFKDAATPEDLFSNVASGNLRAADSFSRSVPDELRRICARCLCVSPSSRFQDAGSLAESLRSWNAKPQVQWLRRIFG
jgi:hypothetical protein